MDMIVKEDGLRIDSFGTKRWYKHNELHRLDGPACIGNSGFKSWWLYGVYHFEDNYNKLISNLPLLYWNRFKQGKWI
jgi:hypothetical protein